MTKQAANTLLWARQANRQQARKACQASKEHHFVTGWQHASAHRPVAGGVLARGPLRGGGAAFQRGACGVGRRSSASSASSREVGNFSPEDSPIARVQHLRSAAAAAAAQIRGGGFSSAASGQPAAAGSFCRLQHRFRSKGSSLVPAIPHLAFCINFN